MVVKYGLVSLVPRLSVQLFFARSKISGQRAWENSSRELRQLRDVGCVVLHAKSN